MSRSAATQPAPSRSAATQPAISVIVPVHDAADTIVAQLDGIATGLDAAPPAEILVVDNRSTDDTAAVARDWAARTGIDLRVIDAHERPGEPYARNVGLREARAELVAYCDGDDVVSPTWLPAMASGLRTACYVTGPIDMDALNPPHLASVRGASVTEGRSLMWDAVPYAHGCNMGFRRDALEHVGGFDETYTAGCDLDIAIRMWEAGHDLLFADGASVAYRLRPTLADTWRQARAYGRHRVRVRDRLDPVLHLGSPRRVHARRLAWLLRRTPSAVWSPATRARWVWVAGQLRGEWLGRRDAGARP